MAEQTVAAEPTTVPRLRGTSLQAARVIWVALALLFFRQRFTDTGARDEAIFSAAIAGELTISVKTVRNHVSNIFNKLQVVDRVQAALRARDVGLG